MNNELRKLQMSHYVRCPILEAQGCILHDACVSTIYCRSECPHYGHLIDYDRNILLCNFKMGDKS